MDIFALFPFAYWFVYHKTATVTGSTVVAVRCEHCREKYYYQLKRTARSESIGVERARRVAKHRLRYLLDNDIDPIPCPHCGWFQGKMIAVMRSWRLRWMRVLGLAALGVSGLGGVAAVAVTDMQGNNQINIDPRLLGAAWAFYLLLLLSAGVLLLVRWYRNAHYDPNDPETEQERIEIGRTLALTKEQAEAILRSK